jgi:hypothetical protein
MGCVSLLMQRGKSSFRQTFWLRIPHEGRQKLNQLSFKKGKTMDKVQETKTNYDKFCQKHSEMQYIPLFI